MESLSGCSLLLLCLQNVLPIPEVNEAHTDQFLTLAEICSRRQVPFLLGTVLWLAMSQLRPGMAR